MQDVDCYIYHLTPQISTGIEKCWSWPKSRIRKLKNQFDSLPDAIEVVLRLASGADESGCYSKDFSPDWVKNLRKD